MNKCEAYVEKIEIIGWRNSATPITKSESHCIGTKNNEICKCNGCKLNCDFYEFVKDAAFEKVKHIPISTYRKFIKIKGLQHEIEEFYYNSLDLSTKEAEQEDE